MACRICKITFQNQEEVNLLPAEMKVGDDENVYTLLIGNNGCGKTRILRSLVNAYISHKKGQYVCGVEYLHKAVKPAKIIVITNTLGDVYPKDMSADETYNSTYYVCLGSRIATGAYAKRHILERSIQILLETQLTENERMSIAEIFNFVGYYPWVHITYQVAARYTKKEVLIDFIKSLPTSRNSAKQNQIYDALSREKFHEIWWDITNDNSIDIHSDMWKICRDRKALLDLILLLRRQGVLLTKQVEVRKPNSENSFSFDLASSGETNMLTSLISLIKLLKDNSLVLIDEPELSMHPDWQAHYMPLLQSIVSHYHGCHVVIASHSHFFASDLESNVSSVVKVEQNENHEISATLLNYAPYAWSAENILLEVFGVPSTRNYYFAQHLQNALNLLGNHERDINEFKKEQELISRVYQSLKDSDPLKAIAKLVMDYDIE